MRVLVCGGRNYNNHSRVKEVLEGLDPKPTVIIEGAAFGADTMAYNWAVSSLVKTKTFSADWDRHGKAAGVIRNQAMLDKGQPDLVVAFPGGRGTADMVRRARKAGVEVMEIEP